MPFAERVEVEREVRQSRCPACSKTMSELVMRLPDPKGVHKCARCRTEMTRDYAARLPGIKASLKKARKD